MENLYQLVTLLFNILLFIFLAKKIFLSLLVHFICAISRLAPSQNHLQDNKPLISLVLEVLFELLFLYKVHFLITKI